jgi:hypothetical protein
MTRKKVMEARKLDKSSPAMDNYRDKIMELSRMNYLQAQAFLTEYWKTDFYKMLEEQFNNQPDQMSADDYLLFVLSRRQGLPDYDKLTLSCQKNELLLNEETKDHLTTLLLCLKLAIVTDQREAYVANTELGYALERRMLKVDPTFDCRINNWNDMETKKYKAEHPYDAFEDKEYDEAFMQELRLTPPSDLPDPWKNPELFPIHQLLIQDRKRLCVDELTDTRMESYLPNLAPSFLNLSSARFKNVKLMAHGLYGVYLKNADFTEAQMPSIFNSYLNDANMSEARVAELRSCILYNVKFNKANTYFAHLQDCALLAPTDFTSVETFSSAVQTLRKNLEGNKSLFQEPFEEKVVRIIINFIKTNISNKFVQVKLLEIMHDAYMPQNPTEAFYSEWNKTGSLWSAAPSFFGALLPRNQFDPAVHCLRLIKAELLPLCQTCLDSIETLESQHRPSMG